MEPNSSQIIADQLKVLPPEIQNVLNGNVIESAIQAIVEIHELTPEQGGALGLEIITTLLGLEFISSFETRAKQAAQLTDERLADVLDSAAGMLFTPQVMAALNEIERIGTEAETAGDTTPAPSAAPIPKASAATPPTPAPAPQPKITANPEQKVVPKGNMATLKPKPAVPVPTGKMVGLKKEQTESTIKGMRTMRGDINKLRGSEEGEIPPENDLKKPFKGK